MKVSGKAIWLLIGFLSFGLGTIGIVLPCLPTVPLYMAAGVCFAKGSRKVHRWFLGTKLYQKHLERFAEKREMTMRAKCSVMVMVTALMLFGFLMMDEVVIGRIVLAIVWVFHLYYFFLRVKTAEESNERVEDGLR